MTDPSESVTRFKGSVPIGTTRPAGRIRQPEGSNVDPSGSEPGTRRSEEHTSELQSPCNLVCRLLLEKKNREHLFSCMNIPPFQHLQAFVAVARHRGFSGAARELGVTRSAVSQAARQLEPQLRSVLLA